MASMMDKRLSDDLLENRLYHTDLFAISYVQELRKIADALEGIRAALEDKNTPYMLPGMMPVAPPVPMMTMDNTTVPNNYEEPKPQEAVQPKRRKN